MERCLEISSMEHFLSRKPINNLKEISREDILEQQEAELTDSDPEGCWTSVT
jgi:hypothetical protein